MMQPSEFEERRESHFPSCRPTTDEVAMADDKDFR